MQSIKYDAKYTDQIIGLWNQTMVADPINKQRFLENIILDDNYSDELCRIALNNNTPIGFIWAVSRKVPYGERGLESQRGWIVLLFVDPQYQNQGIGTNLINDVQSIFAEMNKKLITVATYSPNYLFPGIDEVAYPNALKFFEKNGYQAGGQAVSMNRELFDFRLPAKFQQFQTELSTEDYHLHAFTLNDAEELLIFLKQNFPGGWARNVEQAILQKRAVDTILVMRDKQSEIVGYCQRAIDGNPARFGPFGVKKELRGKHLGVLLFNEMLFDMKKRQVYNVYFLWTGGDAQKFYEKNGMKAYRKYRLIKKEVI